MLNLGTLGGYESYAYGLNAWGQVVGESHLPGETQMHAFSFRDADGDFVAGPGELEDLGTLGGANSVARGVNDSAVVVGGAENGAGEIRACRWVGGLPEDLGTLGGSSSLAHGVDNLGRVVGESLTAGGETHVFLWTPGSGMVDLNARLEAGTGWVLERAFAADDSGRIAGEGLKDGQPVGSALVPDFAAGGGGTRTTLS